VAGRLLAAPGGKLVMTFRPTAPAPVVTFVKFEGSRLIPPQELQKVFYQTAVGTPYTEERFRELLDSNIRPLFEALGRLEVRFGPLRTEESKDATGVELTVPVQDGDEFRFGRVGFAGNTKVSSIELSRLVKLEEGALANFALVNKAVADVERRYGRDGYMHAKATVERKLDGSKKTVDLVIRVSEGDRYTMRTLTIQGLDLNGEDAVRRRWAIQRGQPFDGLYPETFLKRIEEDGMFDNLDKTNFRLNADEPNKAVDVVLEFKGAPAQKRRQGEP
jgi:outer membrane protein insertion porin family